MTSKTITIRDDMTGYLAVPATGTGPGIVVIQEIFGVNAAMRGVADSLAAQGYVALVPDLFWRLESNVQLTDKTDAEWQKAFDLMNRLDKAVAVEDIQASIDALRAMPGVTGKVGAVGYCLGGLLAYLAAARTSVDAAVGYYGVNIQNMLGEAAKIKKPFLLHLAEGDEYTPPTAQAQIAEGLAANPNTTVHRYAGVDHAFARKGGAHYDQAAADLANSRTAAFFKEHFA